MDILKNPTFGKLEQGVIFSCGVAENYDECIVFGLMINARCDIAQDKIDKYCYLPVVNLVDFIEREFKYILISRLQSDCVNTIKNILKSIGESQNIVSVFSLDSVEKNILPLIPKMKDKEKIVGVIDKIKLSKIDYECKLSCAEVFAKYKQEAIQLLKELVSHKLSGYYYLEKIYQKELSCHHIVLLREPLNIPKEIAKKIPSGLCSQDVLAFNGKQNMSVNISIAENDLCMPYGVLKSPFLEHLMQRFSEQFSRVGVEDSPADISDKIYNYVIGGI